MTTQHIDMQWVDVCANEQLPVERGVATLFDGVQIALFRTFDGNIFAVGNRDPVSGANVMARGIVGSRAGVPTVTSPLYKQVFDLATGVCLDDGRVRLAVFEVRVRGGRIEVLR